ncbi:MAG: guanine deaminase [Burkholderiales bacterium]
MFAYRAALLRFDANRLAVFDADGMLVVAPNAAGVQIVHAAGPYSDLARQFPEVAITHWPGRIIAPGFIDLHIHYPQVDVIGSPAEGLLPWLEKYTFPQEALFSSADHCASVAHFFIDELLRNGVTTALAFATSHPESVNALFEAAQQRGMRLITGKCLQDRNSPDGVRDATEQSLIDSEALIQRWHAKGRLGYAITPRFAPACSEAQLRGASELAAKYPDVWIQSHVAENADEIRWAGELFPSSRSYLSIYDDVGLLRSRSIYAHCIHFDEHDHALMSERGAAAAVCPTSNLFLGSGFFDFAAANKSGYEYSFASDVGGGTSFNPFHTMLAAYYVGRTPIERDGSSRPGMSLTPQELWWRHTAGAAQALGLDESRDSSANGNLQPGCEADFVVLNPSATPLLARRTGQASSLDELLFAMIVLGDDRLIEKTVLAQ